MVLPEQFNLSLTYFGLLFLTCFLPHLHMSETGFSNFIEVASRFMAAVKSVKQ